MFNKNDPLISSVTKVMQENQAIRDAENAVNEAYGITDKRQLPFNLHSEYDALVQEALTGKQRNIDVSSPGNPGKPDGKLTRDDFKALQVMKMKNSLKKPMDEQSLDEISADKVAAAARVAGLRADDAGDNNQHKLARALGKQSERLWKKSEEKREKEKADREMSAMSSGKRAKMNMEEAMSALAGTTSVQSASGSTGAGGSSGSSGSTAVGTSVKPVAKISRSKPPQTLAVSARGGTMGAARAGTMGAPMDETSKLKAGKYTKAAADDLADKTDPNYSFMTDTDEDDVARKAENRRKGIHRAVKIMMKEKYAKEERGKKVAGAILEKMRAKAGMEKVVQERAGGTGLAPQIQAGVRQKQVANILKTPNPNTTAATGQQTTGAARIGPTGTKAVGAAPLSDAGKDAAVARMRQQRTDVRTGGAPGAAAAAARPAAKPIATAPKPAAPARTIQGPGGTTATMTGRGTDAIVKTGGQTYKGSVVKNRFGGQSIQNFRAGGGGPVVGKKD